MSRVGSVIALWCKRQLTTRQVVRLALRVARFERWGVRPITQARFAALIAAADAAHTLPAAATAAAALADTRALVGRSAARELAMQQALEVANQKISHLRAVSAAY